LIESKARADLDTKLKDKQKQKITKANERKSNFNTYKQGATKPSTI